MSFAPCSSPWGADADRVTPDPAASLRRPPISYRGQRSDLRPERGSRCGCRSEPRGRTPTCWTGHKVVLTGELTSAMALDDAYPVEALPAARLDASPVAPFVRRRVRVARHLDPVGVAAFEDGGWAWGALARPVADHLADTLCASAAAVVATTPATAVRALAWGAPLVTDPATADAVGILHDVHCVVATGRGGRAGAAREVAADDRLAARISWRGRQHFERWHDLGRIADRVADRLGLPADSGTTELDRALAALGTPRHSFVRTRATRATTTLPRVGRLSPP